MNGSTLQNVAGFPKGRLAAGDTLLKNPSWGRPRSTDLSISGRSGQRSTMEAMLAIGLLMTAPNICHHVVPTNPRPLINQATEQARLAFGVSRYDYKKAEQRRIFTYLNAYPEATDLVFSLPEILDKVYGDSIPKKIEVFLDRDTGDDIMRIAFETGIEDSETWDEKEAELFSLIDTSGLKDGLSHVVLSQI